MLDDAPKGKQEGAILAQGTFLRPRRASQALPVSFENPPAHTFIKLFATATAYMGVPSPLHLALNGTACRSGCPGYTCGACMPPGHPRGRFAMWRATDPFSSFALQKALYNKRSEGGRVGLAI